MKKKILSVALVLSMALMVCVPVVDSYQTDVSFGWTKNLPVENVVGYKIYKQNRDLDTFAVLPGYDAILDSEVEITGTFVDGNGDTREEVKYDVVYETDGFSDTFALTAYNDIDESDYSPLKPIFDPPPAEATDVVVTQEAQKLLIEFSYSPSNMDVTGFVLYANDEMACETSVWSMVNDQPDTLTITCDYTFTQFPVSFVLGAKDTSGNEVKSTPFILGGILNGPQHFKIQFEGTLVVEPVNPPPPVF